MTNALIFSEKNLSLKTFDFLKVLIESLPMEKPRFIRYHEASLDNLHIAVQLTSCPKSLNKT